MGAWAAGILFSCYLTRITTHTCWCALHCLCCTAAGMSVQCVHRLNIRNSEHLNYGSCCIYEVFRFTNYKSLFGRWYNPSKNSSIPFLFYCQVWDEEGIPVFLRTIGLLRRVLVKVTPRHQTQTSCSLVRCCQDPKHCQVRSMSYCSTIRPWSNVWTNQVKPISEEHFIQEQGIRTH